MSSLVLRLYVNNEMSSKRTNNNRLDRNFNNECTIQGVANEKF